MDVFEDVVLDADEKLIFHDALLLLIEVDEDEQVMLIPLLNATNDEIDVNEYLCLDTLLLADIISLEELNMLALYDE